MHIFKDVYTCEFVKFTREFVQIMQEDDYTIIRLAVTEDSWWH